jgi:hypothetical protein
MSMGCIFAVGLESPFEAVIALELCKGSYFQDDIDRLFSNQRRDNVVKVDSLSRWNRKRTGT